MIGQRCDVNQCPVSKVSDNIDQMPNQPKENNIETTNTYAENKPKLNILALKSLENGLGFMPSREYTITKPFLIPMKKGKNDLRFDSIDECMEAILKHCIVNYAQMRRSVAKIYAQQVEVLDLARGGYISGSTFDNREFNKSFTRVSRRIQKYCAYSLLVENDKHR